MENYNPMSIEVVEADFLIGKDKKKITVNVPKNYVKYKLQPVVRHENRILCYNAQDFSFYERVPENPKAKIWLLRRNLEYNYSMRRLCEEAFEMGVHLENVKMQDFEVIVSGEGLSELQYKNKKFESKDLPNAIIPRFGANIDYFAISVLNQLELLGGKMINSMEGIDLSRDKAKTYQRLSQYKLPFPKTLIGKLEFNTEYITSFFKEFPIILKASSSSQGKGVVKINDPNQLPDLNGINIFHTHL